jgi:diguanylate cyclase
VHGVATNDLQHSRLTLEPLQGFQSPYRHPKAPHERLLLQPRLRRPCGTLDAQRRYRQSKEESAELLRMALARMGQHPAALTPLCYAVWYEHLGGLNPALSSALEPVAAGTAPTGPLDDEAVQQLYRQHISPSEGDQLARIGQDLQRLMQGLAQSASSAGDQAGDFGARLDSLNGLLAGPDAQAIAPHLPERMRATARMSESIGALQAQVASSRAEVDRLRGELDRTRAETLIDPLTGVLNRRGFDRALEALMQRGRGERACLVLFDIDHFKTVNDRHGHMVGDMVIKGLGEVLRRAVVRPGASVARYGGEEFAVMLPQANLSNALTLAEQVREMARTMKVRQRGAAEALVSVTVSGGVARRRDDDDAEALLARADAALYRAKQDGRDRIACA